MATIESRQDLIDYSLRSLGGGIISIEVTPEQLEDAVEDAISYYRDYHFDGVDIDYLKFKLVPTVITVADATGFVVNDLLTGATTGTLCRIISITGNAISISRMQISQYASGETISNGTITTTISSISLGPLDLKYLQVDDTVQGVRKVINLSSVLTNSEYMFSAQYQVMLSEIQNLASGSTQYLYSTMGYIAHLDFLLKKEKDFRFNRRMNKVFLDINWDADVRPNEYLVLEVYRYVDDDMYSEVLNDIWLKKYTTASIKKRWGASLKKFEGVQLPGGVTYTGQQIYNEATEEMEKLEQDLVTQYSPLGFDIG